MRAHSQIGVLEAQKTKLSDGGKVSQSAQFAPFSHSTPPGKGHFDGDEMNMQYVFQVIPSFSFTHAITSSIPQSEETRAELRQVAWVPRQVR